MRRIQTQEEIDRKTKRNQLWIGGAMVILLVFATVGYSFASRGDSVDNSKTNENGIDFFRQNAAWVAEFGGSVFYFQNLPSEVSNVSVNVSIEFGQYSGQPLYLVNPREGTSEILNNIGNNILRYQEACFKQELGADDLNNSDLDNESDFVCEGDFPVKDCNSNLIIFKTGNETEVYQEGNCIFILGDSLKGADAFLYRILQVL